MTFEMHLTSHPFFAAFSIIRIIVNLIKIIYPHFSKYYFALFCICMCSVCLCLCFSIGNVNFCSRRFTTFYQPVICGYLLKAYISTF